jgi:hypothetical protein
MNRMAFDSVSRNWPKGAESHVQGDVYRIDAIGRELLKQIRSEVQTSGRRRDGNLPCRIGVDCLIAFDVIRSFALCVLRGGSVPQNVGRQRHLADPIGYDRDGFTVCSFKPHECRSVSGLAHHFTLECLRWVSEDSANGQLFSGFYEAAPDLGLIAHRQKETFHVPARATLRKEACR